ncbi:tyrosine-protein phosphatase [Streptomyces sp. SM14]|uniref:tyrosine-protein phosphatase n=2 Tax=unclassified Streptomyces TaxID=2593676 RepID=UPI0021564C11|nr:tyrosine-protein phosphatase [Streptomyces sp. SM14]
MTQQQSAEPVLTGVRNFRDVAGLPAGGGSRVRPGRLYRSGHLAHATDEDQAFLAGLGLHTVFDFRSSADQALEGHDVALPGVRNVNVPLTDPADNADFWTIVRRGELAQLRQALGDGQAAGRMAASYREMVRERTGEHGRVLRQIATGSTPALLHCSAGKDRAGLTVALALLAAGVRRDAVLEDYLLSNAPHRRYLVRREEGADGGMSPEVMELLSPLFDARADYLLAAFDEIDAGWGSFERYLSGGLGLTSADREGLASGLLEG